MTRPDRDSGDLAQSIRSLTWSIVAGAIGALFGFLVGLLKGWAFAPAILIGFVVGAGFVAIAIRLGGGAATKAMFAVLNPSGRTTPPRPDYSLAESLMVRGRYEEALIEYQHLAATSPADPQVRVRIARLCRDRLDRSAEAERWFRQARDVAADGAAAERLIVQELIELLARTGRQEEALPDLARLADRHVVGPEAEWAKSKARSIREAHGGEVGAE